MPMRPLLERMSRALCDVVVDGPRHGASDEHKRRGEQAPLREHALAAEHKARRQRLREVAVKGEAAGRRSGMENASEIGVAVGPRHEAPADAFQRCVGVVGGAVVRGERLEQGARSVGLRAAVVAGSGGREEVQHGTEA